MFMPSHYLVLTTELRGKAWQSVLLARKELFTICVELNNLE